MNEEMTNNPVIGQNIAKAYLSDWENKVPIGGGLVVLIDENDSYPLTLSPIHPEIVESCEELRGTPELELRCAAEVLVGNLISLSREKAKDYEKIGHVSIGLFSALAMLTSPEGLKETLAPDHYPVFIVVNTGERASVIDTVFTRKSEGMLKVVA